MPSNAPAVEGLQIRAAEVAATLGTLSAELARVLVQPLPGTGLLHPDAMRLTDLVLKASDLLVTTLSALAEVAMASSAEAGHGQVAPPPAARREGLH